jgi:hypothetical protein
MAPSKPRPSGLFHALASVSALVGQPAQRTGSNLSATCAKKAVSDLHVADLQPRTSGRAVLQLQFDTTAMLLQQGPCRHQAQCAHVRTSVGGVHPKLTGRLPTSPWGLVAKPMHRCIHMCRDMLLPVSRSAPTTLVRPTESSSARCRLLRSKDVTSQGWMCGLGTSACTLSCFADE